MKTHWKKLTHPDFLGAYALNPDEDMIVTIKSVSEETYVGSGGKTEEGVIMRFEENVKPLICNKTNLAAIEKATGTRYIEGWPGKKIALYIDPNVKFMGETVEGLRVRPTPPREEFFCEECGQQIKAYKGKSPRALSNYTKQKYGRALCSDCASKEAAQNETNEG